MLLLSSSAFDDPLLFPSCLAQSRLDVRSLRASIVISASPQKGEGPNAIKTMTFLREQAVDTAFADLFDGPPALERLERSDLIVINGGNPFLLLQAVQRLACQDELARWARTKVVVAVSAGGMLFSPGLHHVEAFNAILGFEDKGNPGLSDLDGLGWFDEYFFPHYAEFSERISGLEDHLLELERREGVKLYRQSNGETALVENRVLRPLK